ncbi:MAG: hypothetical protein U0169_06035 [Polyangiaceae bacterium]
MRPERPRGSFVRRLGRPAVPALAFVGLVGACSSSERGELIVVVTSDMALPKDLENIRIDFEPAPQGNATAVDMDVRGTPPLRLPATVAIVAGSGEETPVTITLAAAKDGRPKVLRTVRTAVPKGSVRMVRMPLEFLCRDSAKAEGSGAVSTCPDGKTCVHGECVAPDVPVASLPLYDETAVFGGGTADGRVAGRCFDTLTEFADAEPLTVDPATCSFEDTSTFPLNVALRLGPGSTGICDGVHCYVPLAEGDGGFRRDGTKVVLAKAFCRELATLGGDATFVRGTVGGMRTESSPTCGPWSAIAGGVKPDDSTPSATLEGEFAAKDMHAVGGRLFWIANDRPGACTLPDCEDKSLNTTADLVAHGLAASTKNVAWTATLTGRGFVFLEDTNAVAAKSPALSSLADPRAVAVGPNVAVWMTGAGNLLRNRLDAGVGATPVGLRQGLDATVAPIVVPVGALGSETAGSVAVGSRFGFFEVPTEDDGACFATFAEDATLATTPSSCTSGSRVRGIHGPSAWATFADGFVLVDRAARNDADRRHVVKFTTRGAEANTAVELLPARKGPLAIATLAFGPVTTLFYGTLDADGKTPVIEACDVASCAGTRKRLATESTAVVTMAADPGSGARSAALYYVTEAGLLKRLPLATSP